MNAATRFAPYREAAANDLYHLLFCDDPQVFASMSAGSARAIAIDPSQALAGPVVAAASELLVKVVDLSTTK